MTFRDVAAATGIELSQLHRLEAGEISSPRPEHLATLAQVLEVPFADLYTIAGLPLPTELPTLSIYLRTKYRGLPSDAQQELQESISRITAKYGYASEGPQPGEDEEQ